MKKEMSKEKFSSHVQFCQEKYEEKKNQILLKLIRNWSISKKNQIIFFALLFRIFYIFFPSHSPPNFPRNKI